MIPLSKATKVVSNKENKGVFEIEALYPGYGVTLGNSLRRVLLSSLEGAAATQVKIKGALHEFAALSGVKEDVLGILLNIKQIRFRVFGEGSFSATLKVKGAKEAKAGDFKTPTQIEVVNKDLVLAHLTDKSAELEVEIEVGKGVGYEAAESRKRGKEEIGSISLDAVYTPVRRVSFRVEQMRVGDRTDFDRLIMEIETDGTMNPETALKEAAGILVKHFEIVGEGLKTEETKQAAALKPKTRRTAGAKKPAGKKPRAKKAAAKKK
ncbi:MAG: DNA-directed RNA polymerase subunit alpha [Candidatus Wildermuthbacteria bacterium RIFCSPHIGHO2_02_FULL_49_9]|uniref:DNA-directed RNA polymerase subunit alpha n=2 Tax=Candidatus Wildermuthiibacteriota TaxID=1817923 RepID=A0A1G2QW57_9BACT|nr:MAG: DNA-directed RNA polymerase subunit alpha [Candidatus Wildermuthbacteria bacterium RIFCSPHIGHO2_01_FULL_49_22b]OHA70092.1 MAG: DNA-directed RNA polymerase subunit alpha [Candidatus Wildermuthbacteria bacterium RIFCSPHIGHO2_02_FULL_49_9]